MTFIDGLIIAAVVITLIRIAERLKEEWEG